MPILADAAVARVFAELGAVVLGLALLSRLGSRFGLSPIPLYLLAGLAFGDGGLLPLEVTEGFVHVAAEVGVILLLFMLGLEYTGAELVENLRGGLPAGAADAALNFTPGFAAGLLLGFGPLAAVVLGGVTWVSSSGVAAKVLADLGRLDNPETPTVLSILVLEDLAMAVFLPLVSVLLVGRGLGAGLLGVAAALAVVAGVLYAAVRFGKPASEAVSHPSEEVNLLTTLGLVLLVAGAAEWVEVSAAVGAFLVGIAVSGPLVGPAHRSLGPLRDLFAALFFFFFGLRIDPAALPPALPAALALAAVTAGTKLLTGWWAARRAGVEGAGRWRAGAALVARGEFSVVLAGLGAAVEPQLRPLAAAYVLVTAVAGPVLARLAGPGKSD